MLEIIIPEQEMFNDNEQKFFIIKEQKIKLEHSLVSISKWEAKWRQSYFDKKDKTSEQVLDYIKCMTITQNVKDEVYRFLLSKDYRVEKILTDISDYIGTERTATTFYDVPGSSNNNSRITSEIIYSWMITYNIPMECQKWHLSRLLALIRVMDNNNNPQSNKMTRQELIERNRNLNEQRKKAMNTNG